VIIATRMLKLRGEKCDIEILIRIFAPEQSSDSAWLCRYEINWPEEKWTSYAGGIDSAQAITLALQKIGTEIYFGDYHKSGNLFWESPGKGYGFPLPPSARDLLIGDDAKFF